jgi:ribosomal-protein-alanine N-acetyltransferase
LRDKLKKKTMKIHLQTKRCIIRDIEESDLEGMFDLDSNPNVHKYLGNSPISTRKEAQEIIANIREQYKKFGIGRWAIEDKATGDFIGWTGFKREEKLRPDRVYIDIGYRLREKFWGKGIGTETALACLNFGFETLNFEEVCGCADTDHIASNNILRKIGLNYIEDFTFEGDNLHWYTLKKSEWNSNL